MEPLWDEGVIVFVDASQNTRRLPRGMTVDELYLDEDHRNTCEQNLRQLAQAAREFALQNDGMLPGADTWREDLALHLPMDPDDESLFHCPATDGLGCSYAINASIAARMVRPV